MFRTAIELVLVVITVVIIVTCGGQGVARGSSRS